MKRSSSVSIGVLGALCLLPQALAATYYVDRTLGNDSYSGNSPTLAWRTISRVNASPLLPGDVVRFKRGEVWRDAALIIPSSGAAGAPVTFSDYGSGALPVINGADVVTGWALSSGSIYFAPWNFASSAAFQSDTPLRRASSISNLSAGSFFCDNAAGKVYVWTTNGVHPGNFIMELTRRGAFFQGLIDSNDRQYLVIENLRLLKSNFFSIRLKEGAHYVIRGNTIEHSYHNVVTTVGYLGMKDTTDVSIIGNTMLNNGLGRHGPVATNESECVGVNAAAWLGVGGLISGNTIINQGGEGIQVLAGARNVVIEKNKVINAVDVGIYVSSGYGNSATNGGTVSGIIVRYNYVALGARSAGPNYAIASEENYAIDGTLMHHNVAVGNGTPMGGLLFGSGGKTYFGAKIVGPIRNSRIYNNTFVKDSYYGVRAFGPTVDTSNVFRNNVFSVGSWGRAYWIAPGATGNPNPPANYDIDYDLMYSPTASEFIVESGTTIPGTLYNLAQWRAATGKGLHSLVADPMFANAGANNYSLQAGSPAWNSGANLGAPFQLGLNPATVWPDVLTLDQNVHGSAWEMGAYVYPEAAALSLVSVTPSSGSGSAATFIAAVSNSAGASSISLVNLTINDIPYNANACALTYEAASNKIYLFKDDFLAGTSEGVLGSATVLSNSQCSINLAGASATLSGSELSLKLPVAFTTKFAETNPTKNIYLRAVNNSGASAGYTQMGTWTVVIPNRAPQFASAASASPSPATAGASVWFSVLAYDPDGDALSYSWNFGDGAVGSGPSPNHTYAAAGTYTATATVADGKGGSAQSSLVLTVDTVTSTRVVHVRSILLSVVREGGNRKFANAQVIVADQNGLGVGGASVSGRFSGLVDSDVAGVSGANGVVWFASPKTKQLGIFTFAVTAVWAAGYVYDPSKNLVSSASITTSGVVTTAALDEPASAPPLTELEEALSLGTVSQGQPFKFRLEPPSALARAARFRVQAGLLPSGARLRGKYIGGRFAEAGNYVFNVQFSDGAAQVERLYTLTVLP